MITSLLFILNLHKYLQFDLTWNISEMDKNPPAYTYQTSTNTSGFVTTNQVSLPNQVEPCLHNAPRVSIYDPKPAELVIKNPLPIHDLHVTTNNVYYGRKFYDEKFAQPQHPLSPESGKVLYIRPDFHRKMAKGDYNPRPIYDKSETHDKFTPLYGNKDMYGGPTVFIDQRHVFVPQYKDYIYPFPKDAAYSVIKMSHPYLSQSSIAHRHFGEDELRKYEMINAIEKKANEKNRDVAIKYRVRPMYDPFENVVKDQRMNLEFKKENPSAIQYPTNKIFFRKRMYEGCAPRVFQPVPHCGWNPHYTEKFGPPFSNHSFTKDNFTSPLRICYTQPKPSASGTMKIPNMYSTESGTYGSGRCVNSFIEIGRMKNQCDFLFQTI